MKKLLLILAVVAGKIVIIISRMLGNQGTDFPGKVAKRIYPYTLRDLAKNITEDIIIITGTNGKTTTANLIAAVMKKNGLSLVHNQAGANLISGITTAFIEKTNLTGTKKFAYALLETDEANIPLLFEQVTPGMLLITNFFRDQLDRYGELDNTIKLIKDAIRHPEMKLLLNADDPLAAHFQRETGLNTWYYGFSATIYDSGESNESREGRHCVLCASELQYEMYHYAQLGKFKCPGCGSQNPECDFVGHGLLLYPGIELNVNDMRITSHYQGFYNAYNILATVSVCKLLEIGEEEIRAAISNYLPHTGRMENFQINGKRAVLILVKNPAGLNQALSTLSYDPTLKSLLFILNDNVADGRDISWIWDANIEIINEEAVNISKIICSGQRNGDMAVRIKYSGFADSDIIIKSGLQNAIAETVKQATPTVYILCTYTALFECRRILHKLADADHTDALAENELKRRLQP